MTLKIKKIAMIGFEFKHHVPAAIKAFEKLKEEDLIIIPVIWSGRNGVKSDIINNFHNCVFLDDFLGYYGKFDEKIKLIYEDEVNLTELEIKHFSYTHSRTKYFRDPRKITVQDKIFYERILNFAMTMLSNCKVEIVFFVKLPHILMDLAFLYAARRLNIDFIYTDGPFYGDDYVFSRKDDISVNALNNNANFYCSFKKIMDERNLKKNLLLPHYQRENLNYMASVPESNNPFFYREELQVIYFFIKSEIFVRLLSLIVRKLIIFISWVIRKALFETPVESLKKKYILVLLQYHPEQTTSPSAFDTPFEEERVIALAVRFPNYQIVMREHPTNLKSDAYLTYRNPFLIKKLLKQFSNVTYQLPGKRKAYQKQLENAFFTVSTSGTVALESIQLGVPSIHFYNSFASGFPGVHIISDVSMITEELIESSRNNLNKLGSDGIIDKSYEVVCTRNLEKGFLCGYHENIYSNNEYISNAANIIHKSLNYLILR
jgi:hypothetical protein